MSASSPKSMSQPVSGFTAPAIASSTVKECPWSRSHLCPWRDLGEPVSRLEAELVDQADVHDARTLTTPGPGERPLASCACQRPGPG